MKQKHTPLHVSLNISAAKPSFKNLYELFDQVAKDVSSMFTFEHTVLWHLWPLGQKRSYRLLKDGLAAEILRETCKRGLFFASFCSIPMRLPLKLSILFFRFWWYMREFTQENVHSLVLFVGTNLNKVLHSICTPNSNIKQNKVEQTLRSRRKLLPGAKVYCLSIHTTKQPSL